MTSEGGHMRQETESALQAVRLGHRLLAAELSRDLEPSRGGRDIVTVADLRVEDTIRAELRRWRPAYPVIGEERGGELTDTQQPYWLIDPICGTRAFASGL